MLVVIIKMKLKVRAFESINRLAIHWHPGFWEWNLIRVNRLEKLEPPPPTTQSNLITNFEVLGRRSSVLNKCIPREISWWLISLLFMMFHSDRQPYSLGNNKKGPRRIACKYVTTIFVNVLNYIHYATGKRETQRKKNERTM